MSDIKQETGYFRATPTASAAAMSAKAWAGGDLSKTLLNSALPGSKEIPAAAAAKRDLNAAAPKIETEQPAAKAQAPEAKKPEAATAAPKIENAQPEQEQPEQPKAQAPVEPKPQAFKTAPAAFAPIIAAGVLSNMQRQQAAPLAKDDAASYRQGDEFQLGKGGLALKKRLNDEREERNNDNDGENRADALMRQYLDQQQQQAFMQSMEYSVALQTVNQEITQLKAERTQTMGRIADLKAREQELNQKIETGGQEVAKDEKHVDDLKDLKGKRDENALDQQYTDAIDARYTQIHKDANQLLSAAPKIDGTDVILTVVENGQSVQYKVGENGQKEKMSGGIYTPDQYIFSKKTADGKTEYVNLLGQPISAEHKARIDKAMTAAGVKPEDAIPDLNKYKETREAAETKAEQEDTTLHNVGKAIEKEAESKKKLESEAARLGFDMKALPTIDARIRSMEDKIKEQKIQIATWKEDKTKTAEEIILEEKKLERVEEKLKESTDFKSRLEKGEFRNTAEMQAALPNYLRGKYDQNLAEKQASAPLATAKIDAPASNNTTRVSGSAAASIESEGQIKAGVDKKLTEQYRNAAAATTPEVTVPEEKLVATATARPTVAAPPAQI